MIRQDDPNRVLSRLIERHLGLQGSFALQVRQARRLMPGALRRDAEYLLDVERLQGNPKLARQIDPSQADAARRRLRRWLTGPDPRRRKTRRLLGVALSFLVSLSLGLFLIAALAAR